MMCPRSALKRLTCLLLGASAVLTADATVLFSYDFNGLWDAEDHKYRSGGSDPAAQTWPTVWKYSQMQNNSNATVTSLPGGVAVRGGTKSMKFVWFRDSYDPAQDNNTKKAHLWSNWFGLDKDDSADGLWYRFSMYMPSTGMETDSYNEILMQLHGRPSTGEATDLFPPVSIQHVGTKLRLIWYSDSTRLSTRATLDKRGDVDLGSVPYDKWMDWKCGFKFDYNSPNGMIVIKRRLKNSSGWSAWQTLYSSNAAQVGYNDDSLPQLGIGIYKFDKFSDTYKREIYFDSVKIATSEDEVEY